MFTAMFDPPESKDLQMLVLKDSGEFGTVRWPARGRPPAQADRSRVLMRRCGVQDTCRASEKDVLRILPLVHTCHRHDPLCSQGHACWVCTPAVRAWTGQTSSGGGLHPQDVRDLPAYSSCWRVRGRGCAAAGLRGSRACVRCRWMRHRRCCRGLGACRCWQHANYNQGNCRTLLLLALQLQQAVVEDPAGARLSGLVAHLVPALESLAHFMSVFHVWCARPARPGLHGCLPPSARPLGHAAGSSQSLGPVLGLHVHGARRARAGSGCLRLPVLTAARGNQGVADAVEDRHERPGRV